MPDAEMLYEWICRQDCAEGAVGGLADADLRELHHYLSSYATTGVPGLILALCLAEAAKRFLTA
jgi:hypothetical protein